MARALSMILTENRLLLRHLSSYKVLYRLTGQGLDQELMVNQRLLSRSTSAAALQFSHGANGTRRKNTGPREPLKMNYSTGPESKPNLDQLQKVYNALQISLEKMFTQSFDYSIYHPDVVFIDNIRHIRTQGLSKYVQQVALLRTVGHLKFAYVRFEIINMSMSPEEGRITVRWRIKGLSGLRVMLKFWKYKLWRWQDLMKQQETWHDGISYFDVGADGKIFQHIADKVMEDKNKELEEKPTIWERSLPMTNFKTQKLQGTS